jgi:sugar O-acyltransferase (sialic acid O-acetyltransferase NeuD family)
MNKKVIVVGSGGHAKVVIDILHEMNCFQIIGITSDSLEKGVVFSGYPVLGDDDYLKEISPDQYEIAVGLGGYRNNDLRTIVYQKIKSLGFNFVNAIHPSAIISKTAKFGEAIIVFPGVTINTDVSIGNNSIVATGSTIDHETKIGNNVLVSAGVTIGAYAELMDNSLLALGSKVISGVKIGRNAVVAAGAVVIHEVHDNDTVFGIPAKRKNL